MTVQGKHLQHCILTVENDLTQIDGNLNNKQLWPNPRKTETTFFHLNRQMAKIEPIMKFEIELANTKYKDMILDIT